MFVDAYALVSILANEHERHHFVRALNEADEKSTSPVAVFEASIAISKMTRSCMSALSEVMRLIQAAEIRVVPMDAELLPELGLARDRNGKGSGHPARLNLGDCFSYAMAKRLGVPLLYKGDDFAATDLA